MLAALALCGWLFLPWDRLTEGVEWVRGRGLWGALVIGGGYAIATVLMLPGSLVTLFVGYLYGPIRGFLLVSPASVAGATLAFLLGRGLARGWIEKRMQENTRFQALDAAIADSGFRILVLTRLSPVFPFVILNYAFGLTRLSLHKYVLGSFLGMLPGTFLYVYLGSTVEDLQQLTQGGAPEAGTAGQVMKWVGLFATVVVTVMITRTARAALRDSAPEALNPTSKTEESPVTLSSEGDAQVHVDSE